MLSGWLESEIAAASNMKSAGPKKLLAEAADTAKKLVGGYKTTPGNGLVLFCGEAQEAGGKGRPQRIAIDIEPFKPIQALFNKVDTCFNMSALQELLEDGKGGAGEAMLASFMEEVVRGTGKACFGIRDAPQALEAAAVTHLVVWEGLDLRRVRVRDTKTGDERNVYLTPSDDDAGKALDPAEGEGKLELVERSSFVEWIRDHAWVFGIECEVVGDKTEKGRQLREGYGGIGVLLRYRMDFEPPDEE